MPGRRAAASGQISLSAAAGHGLKCLMLSRLRIDAFTLAIFAAVLVASLMPVSGTARSWLEGLVKIAIALMFFMHGAKLSRAAVLAGLTHWRLHAVILAATYVLFPVLGLTLARITPGLPDGLVAGIIYLSILPSTVQSSIAFTSMGRGNVAAAVCAASASNFIGVFLTPILAAVLMKTSGVTISFAAVKAIMLQLLLPFVLGQILQPYVGAFVKRHGKVLSLFDRGSIVMVVFLAFSEAVIGGLWQRLTPATLLLLVALMAVLLAVVLLATRGAARGAGL